MPPGFVSLLLAITSLGPSGSPGLEPAKGNLERAELWLRSPKWRGDEGRSVHSSSHSGAGLQGLQDKVSPSSPCCRDEDKG